MTENGAIEIIKYASAFNNDNSPLTVALGIAIAALEEIQQYRAIGTVEECREDKNFLEFLHDRIQPNEMEQYLSMYRTKDKTKVNGYADQSSLMSAT